jgi:hexosaminidase
LLLEVDEDSAAGLTRHAGGKPVPTAYVWNNVWGWGREDAAYRLANAGFNVVLCNATHLYIDLAIEKDPLEPGYYWAGYVDARAPFEFAPLEVYKNARRTAMGQPLSGEEFVERVRLTPQGAKRVLGIQGQLWSENLRSADALEYMAFPRAIALAERAWARQPAWADVDDPREFERQLAHDWNRFANRLAQRELARLDYLLGGVKYRLPPPGAQVRNGLLRANVAFPGLQIRYTVDGTEPGNNSALYREPIPTAQRVKLKSFDTRGRGSRTVALPPADQN